MASGYLAWRSSLLRRGLFQAHLWVGVAIGVYLCVISLTGAALLFRIDFQRVIHADLLVPASPDVRVGPEAIVDALAARYPGGKIAGVDAPTTARPVYLAYVTQADNFLTVLADPSDGRILGELPDASPVRVLQDLHFNLLAGRTGEWVNGIGALCLILLALTGIVIWWQGKGRWTRGLRVRWAGNPGRRIWELHSAAGIWSVALIALWAVTALSFTFPTQFRAVVQTISPLSDAVTPTSRIPSVMPPKIALAEMIERARRERPGEHVARVVLPSSVTGTVQVLFSTKRPTPALRS